MNKRIDYIDNAKGILILMIVFGHVFTTGYAHDFIYTFHVPAFFIITGILFNYSHAINKPFKEYLITKIIGLFIPLVIFEIIGIFTYLIRYGCNQSIFGFIYNALSGNFNNSVDWFLAVLFVDELLFYFIRKYCEKFIPFFAIVSFVLSIFTDRMFLCLSFILIGYAAKQLFINWNAIVFIVSAILTGLSFYTNSPIEIRSMTLNNIFLFLIGSLCGTYVIIQISKKFPLSFYGKESLVIMGTHQLLLLPLLQYTNIDKIIILVITITYETALCAIIKKIKSVIKIHLR